MATVLLGTDVEKRHALYRSGGRVREKDIVREGKLLCHINILWILIIRFKLSESLIL